MTNSYQPIDCNLHSQFELAAMHKTLVELTLTNQINPVIGVIRDLYIKNGGEYLDLHQQKGEILAIRLDTIHAFQEHKEPI